MTTKLKLFGAPTCMPCQAAKNTLTDALKIPFEYVDCESNPDLAAQYEVGSTPTMVVERDGEIIDRTFGGQDVIRLANEYASEVK